MTLLSAARADNQTPDYTQPVTNFPLPYSLSLAVNNFGATPLPTLNAFASGQAQGDWVLLGGTSNGLHGFSAGLSAFPPASENQNVWVVDPVTKQSWSRSLVGSGLSQSLIDALTSSSQESMQVGNTLYVVGGYGLNSATGTQQTFSNLTAIDLNSLIAWVQGSSSAPAATGIFRTVTDPSLQVTGGTLANVNGTAMLVFGQNFDGNFNPSANGNYTNQVRSFNIVNTAASLSITNLSASPADASLYRRSDANVVGTLQRNFTTGALSEGLVALGGAFTTTGGIWTIPVTIGADGIPHSVDPNAASTLKQAVNVFSDAHFGSFSQVTGANYISLFGGLSYATYDPNTKIYSTDAEIPFSNSITTVTIDKNGKFTQSMMAAQFPVILSTGSNPGNTLLFGTDAQFFAAPGIPQYDDGVIDLDGVMANATSDNVTLGYIFGGIASTLPNTNTSTDSAASNTVFAVTVTLPPLVDLSTAGTVTAGTADMVRRLVVESAGAQYMIPVGADTTAFGSATVQSGALVVNGTLDTHAAVFNGGASTVSGTLNAVSLSITGGTLADNGVVNATSGLTISGSGVLRGTGTINAPTVVSGTLRPGNSPGTLTFTQSVVQNASGTLMLDIDGTGTGSGAGNFSRVLVTGAGNSYTAAGTIAPVLRGLTGSASNTYSPALYQHFTVVSASGGVTGTFASVTEPSIGLLPGTRFDVAYASNSIDLVVTPQSFATLAPLGGTDTPNRSAVGVGVDVIRGAPGLVLAGDNAVVMAAIYGQPVSSLGASFDQIAGAVHGDALVAASSLDRMVMDAVPDELQAAQQTGRLWLRGAGRWTQTAGDGNAPGSRAESAGLVGGYDLVQRPDMVLGVGAGYAIADVAARNAAQAHVTSGQAIVYAAWADGDWRVDDRLSMGLDHFDTRRFIQIGTLDRTANGAVNGWSLTGDVTVHYDGGLIVPFGTLHYDYIGRDAFAESGAGALALNVRRGKLSTPRTVVGGDIKLDQLLGDTGWAPNARLGWVHDFGVTAGRTDSALAGAPSSFFTTRSSRAGHDAILVGLDVSRAITDNINLFAGYNLEARTRRTSQNIMAGARIQF